MAYCHPETQAMAALLPAGSRLRTDPFSVGQQFLHGVAGHLSRLWEEVRRFGDGGFLGTAPLNVLDTLYAVHLGEDFQFEQDLADPRQTSFRVPFIRGFHAGNIYPVAVLPGNSLADLEQALPTRVDSDGDRVLGPTVLPPTAVRDLSGAAFAPLSIPGRLYLTLEGMTQKGVVFNGQLQPAAVHLKGITTKGTVEEEVVEFPTNMTVRSRRRYRRILWVKPLNIVPDAATLALSGAEHRFSLHPDFEFAVPVGRREQYAVWSLKEGVLSASHTVLGNEKEIILSPYLRWRLVDQDGQALPAEAMAVVPRRPWLAVVHQGRLHLYHKLLEYPEQERLGYLTRRTDGCVLTVESESFCYLPGETAEVMPRQVAPGKEVMRYQWRVAPPGQDLSVYVPQSGVLTPAGGDLWLTPAEAPASRYYGLLLTQPGWWVVSLAARYADGSTSTDVRLFGSLQKRPLATFTLEDILPDADHVFADSDERLWVAAGTAARRLRFRVDAALVDYLNKMIFFKEDYDEVEVIP